MHARREVTFCAVTVALHHFIFSVGKLQFVMIKGLCNHLGYFEGFVYTFLL